MKRPLKEDAVTEFKSSFTDSVIESLVAFANTNGGRVFIGLNDKGEPVKGFTIGDETMQKWVNEVKNKTQPSIIPDIKALEFNGSQVCELSVKKIPVKPVSFKGRYYKRINNANHHLSVTEISDLNLQSLQVSWDSYPAQDITFDDLDLIKIESFISKVNTIGRFKLIGKALDSLKKLKLIKGSQITNAAWLLFGKDNIGYNVHLGRLKTPTYIIDDRMLNTSLFETVENVMQYLVSQIKVAFEIKGMPTQRTEIFEYPIAALREIILNSLIHRDYMSPVDVQIKIFDNRITFFNPGSLYGGLTLQELKGDNYQAYARNKLIAEAFYLTGDIEKYGSGFLRIRQEISTYPSMKLDFEELPRGFLVTLSYTEQKISTDVANVNENVNENVHENVNEKLSNSQKRIVNAMQLDKWVTIEELSRTIGIAKTNIARNVKKLIEKNIIKRIGPANGGYWEIS